MINYSVLLSFFFFVPADFCTKVGRLHMFQRCAHEPSSPAGACLPAQTLRKPSGLGARETAGRLGGD